MSMLRLDPEIPRCNVRSFESQHRTGQILVSSTPAERVGLLMLVCFRQLCLLPVEADPWLTTYTSRISHIRAGGSLAMRTLMLQPHAGFPVAALWEPHSAARTFAYSCPSLTGVHGVRA